MKVGVYYNNSKVVVENRDIPDIDDNELLIKVHACGICGSDLMEWYRIKRAPLVLGHELSGEVVKAGKNIKKFKVGDRVFSTHHVPCNSCYYCFNGHETACEYFQKVNNHSPGGFSEYLKITNRSVDTGTFILPESMSYEEATFIEPLGTVIRALKSIEIKPGDSLLILGSGVIALLMIKVARLMGAGLIVTTDFHKFRLSAAKNYGANAVFMPDADIVAEAKKINSKLFDKVVLCTGALTAVDTAMRAVDKGGTLLFFAVPKPEELVRVDFNKFWRDDVTIKTCYGASVIDNIEAMNLIQYSKIDVIEMITHKFTLEQINDAFKTASDGSSSLKVVVYPHGW